MSALLHVTMVGFLRYIVFLNFVWYRLQLNLLSKRFTYSVPPPLPLEEVDIREFDKFGYLPWQIST